MLQNKVKQLLSDGQAAWGAGLVDDSDLVAKFTVDTGIDFLWIDLEHRPYDFNEVKWIPIICRMKGCDAIVRVAHNDPALIKKALDIGATGVMIPQVNNVDEARQAVAHCKYPPQGSRGVSPLWNFYLDVGYEEYLPVANDETCVIVEIETAEGIENLEAICAVEGIDVIFAGPTDIAAALGYIEQLEHPEVKRFLQDFAARVTACGKQAGITKRGIEAAQMAYDQGYRFIVIGNLAYQGGIALKANLHSARQHER